MDDSRGRKSLDISGVNASTSPPLVRVIAATPLPHPSRFDDMLERTVTPVARLSPFQERMSFSGWSTGVLVLGPVRSWTRIGKLEIVLEIFWMQAKTVANLIALSGVTLIPACVRAPIGSYQ